MLKKLIRLLTARERKGAIDLSPQKAWLPTDEHFRAFSPEPESDSYPLAGRPATNDSAIALLRQGGVTLTRVKDRRSFTLSELPDTVILFVTVWEPYSAQTIGSLRRSLDASPMPFAVVYFEETVDRVLDLKGGSWFFDHCYVLSDGHRSLAELIGRVPIIIHNDSQGGIKSVTEGIWRAA